MISSKDYELALLEKLRMDFAGTTVRVLGTENGREHKVQGRHSLTDRQLDAAAYRPRDSRPFLIADAKRHSVKMDVREVDTFVGMVDDVGAGMGLLVAPKGFTEAARRRAKASSVRVWTLSPQEALTCKWLPLAREIYPHDWFFRNELALAVRRLREKAPPSDIIEALEPVAFDEWEAFMEHALRHQRADAIGLLHTIASEHYDDGWRFNAIRHLIDSGSLDKRSAEKLLSRETDPEVREILEDV